MSSSLGFKLSVAGGSTAATASAAAGGIYLSSSDSSEETTENKNPEKATGEDAGSKKDINKKTKNTRTRRSKPGTAKWVTSSNNYSENPSVINNSHSEKLGDRYSLFLASTSIDNNENDDNKNAHLAWWEDKYELWQKDKQENIIVLDPKFKEVSQAYNDSDSTSLNQICKASFEATESTEKSYTFDLNKSDQGPIKEEERNIKDIEKNFWRYCSPLMVRPWNMVESREASTDNAHISYYYYSGYDMAATLDNINDEYWKIKNKWFLDLWNSGKVDTNFKSYIDKKNSEVKENGEVSLRKVCHSVRNISINGSYGELKAREILIYCAFSEHFFKPSQYSHQAV